jgi:hypothetical protein
VEESNWANNNAINAETAQQDKSLLETPVKTELNVHATSNTTLPLTHVPTVPQDNWEMPQLEDAKPLQLDVMQEEEFNWANNNAISAETAQSDKYMLMDQIHAEHHHQYAHVTNKLTLQLTHARTAQLVL